MKQKIYILIALLGIGLAILIFVPLTGNAPTKTSPGLPIVLPQSGSVTLGMGQKVQVGDLGIALSGQILDSRCPTGAQCIWAGEVKVSVVLTDATGTQTTVLSSNKKPFVFDNHQVSIIGVTPAARTAAQQIAQSEYKITFHVEVASNTK